MIRLALILLAPTLLILAGAARAEEIVPGLSQNEIAITVTFDGSDILIFGAVKREAPIRPDAPLGVVITVAGPETPVTVWRQARRMGIWVNDEAVRIEAAPSFYAVATTGPLNEVLTSAEDRRHRITIPRAIGAAEVPGSIADAPAFSEALIRIRARAALYQLLEGGVNLEEETLFRTSIRLPANLVEGDYATRIFLTRGGEVIDHYQTAIAVQKVGLERWIFTLAGERPLLYGLLALAIAVSAGWGAAAAFGTRRR